MVAESIDPIEKEFGINVVTALQIIAWSGLGRHKGDDKIAGFGRLSREF